MIYQTYRQAYGECAREDVSRLRVWFRICEQLFVGLKHRCKECVLMCVSTILFFFLLSVIIVIVITNIHSFVSVLFLVKFSLKCYKL